MQLDHIGIAVRSIEKAIPHIEKVFGYHQVTEVVVNSRQMVKVVFLEKKDSTTFKLIEPTCPESQAANALKKGQTLHHLCFKCSDIQEELINQREFGLRVLVEPQPGEAFENEDIAFVYAGLGLNIELIDTDLRAKRITPPDKNAGEET